MNNPDDIVKKEQERQEVIVRAIAAAQSNLDAFGSDDPDIQAYMLVKVGAGLLQRGVSLGVDRRVMLSDLGLTQLVEVPPEQKVDLGLCICGRELMYGEEPDSRQCIGCHRTPKHCNCRILSASVRPNEKPVENS